MASQIETSVGRMARILAPAMPAGILMLGGVREASALNRVDVWTAPAVRVLGQVSAAEGYAPGSLEAVAALLALLVLIGGWAVVHWIRLKKLKGRMREQAFLRIAFDETDEPILVLHASLRVLDANLAAAVTFGFDVEELAGMPLRALLGAEGFQRFAEASRRALRTSRETVDVSVRAHVPEPVPARATLRALPGNEDHRFLVAFRLYIPTGPPEPEVSEPELSEPELSEPEVSEPEVSEPEVSEPEVFGEEGPDDYDGSGTRGPLGYLSNMGHEMRTQLTGILGFAEVLEEELTGRQKETAQLVRRSGQRLLHTINEILMLSRLEAGRVTLHPEDVDVTAEIAEEVQLLLRWAEEKGLGLHVRQPALPVVARIDPGAFRRVLENLVSNAIKYTEKGTVEIGVRTDEEHLYLTVKDTGIGISPAFMPHLFEEFSREAPGVSGRTEGTGLGLAITERLVKMMGGVIHVESEPGRGTRFEVVFPLRPSSPAEA